ncbi:MAG: asparagine synthase (glutamine-hydrolyzing), partial [Polyangiales bacterium]
MCGIAGVLDSSGVAPNTVRTMLSCLQDRGPDASAVTNIHGGAIGHTRLSIVDLRAVSNQPFQSPDGRYTLVFNGEIYNYQELRRELGGSYRFRTRSDTEVLLAAYIRWGRSALERLQGMFAFAVWDEKERSLFAARDRFGVKPFFYSEYGGAFSFASEIKALWMAGVPRAPNERTWAAYLSRGMYRSNGEVFWRDVLELPSGCLLRVRDGRVSTERWYSLDERVQGLIESVRNLSDDDVLDQAESLLLESVRLRLHADVPVSVNLSGGLDSSLLLALTLRHGAEGVTAYSFYTGDPRYDELPWIEKMLEGTGVPLTGVPLGAEEVPTLAREVALKQDEPFGGIPTLAYAKLFQAARSAGRLVLLDGQGLDEAWAGYDYYQTPSNAPVVQGVRSSAVRPQCASPELLAHASELSVPTPFDDALRNVQWRDLMVTKLPRALRFNDRVSMAASTELREPFLHHELVELGVAARADHKIRDGVSKWTPRTVARRLLPKEVALSPKRPVQTPQREWLRSELRDWASDMVNRLFQSSVAGWFDEAKTREELQRYFDQGGDNSFYIWQWINTALL